MKPRETQKLIISVTPKNANPVLEYESDNPDVVTAAIGTLIANNEGVANITVRVSGTEIQDSVQVTVSNKTPEEEKPGVDTPGEEDDDLEEENIKVGVIIECDGKKYYITGDTLYNTDIFEDIPDDIDVMFLPVNGVGNNMNMEMPNAFAKKYSQRLPYHSIAVCLMIWI